jgi:hypothetical protein
LTKGDQGGFSPQTQERDKMTGEGEKIKWYLRPVSVILLLFFALGPLGLPLLYKSPKFSKALKAVLTIIVVLYTCYLIFATLEIGKLFYLRMEELQNALK